MTLLPEHYRMGGSDHWALHEEGDTYLILNLNWFRILDAKDGDLKSCYHARTVRDEWREVTRQELPTNPDPLMGFTNAEEMQAYLMTISKLEGKIP